MEENVIQLLESQLAEQGFHVYVLRETDWITLHGVSKHQVSIRIFKTQMVFFTCMIVRKTEPERRRRILEELNRCNHQYLCIKFILDRKARILAQYERQAAGTPEEISKGITEDFMMFLKVICAEEETIRKAAEGGGRDERKDERGI